MLALNLFVFGTFLVVTGCTMLVAPRFHMPIQWSLGIVAPINALSAVASLALTRADKPAA